MPRLSPVAAFWARVDKSAGPDACWPWTGSTFRSGYGQIGNRHLPVLAHRAAHQLTHGAIPRGACVLHRCDNPLCCNPAHLFVGSARDNARDKAAKGRCRNYVLGAEGVARLHALRAAGRRSEDIARDLGITEGTVRYYFRRAAVAAESAA